VTSAACSILMRSSLPDDVIARSQNRKATRVDTTSEVRRPSLEVHLFLPARVVLRQAGLPPVVFRPWSLSALLDEIRDTTTQLSRRDENFQQTASIVSIAAENADAMVLTAVRISRRARREVPPVRSIDHTGHAETKPYATIDRVLSLTR
jgi:hypothetical protein